MCEFSVLSIVAIFFSLKKAGVRVIISGVVNHSPLFILALS